MYVVLPRSKQSTIKFVSVKCKYACYCSSNVSFKGVNALFVPTFWGHLYFDPYIFILPFLVANIADDTIKIIIKKIILALKNATSAFKLILIK